MIELKAVSHDFDSTAVLTDVSLTLAERRIAVIGSNGSGKTTFARTLNGLLVPASGDVTVFGISTRSDARAARRNVGLVFQNPDTQIVMPTVEEDLAFGLENQRLPKAEIAARVDAWLITHNFTGKRHNPAHLLSGGEKKLLSILSVLIMEPRLVVFDEPFASLDRDNRARIASLIDSLPQPVIIITHDIETLGGFDRALCFDRGRVIADGGPRAVSQAYADLNRVAQVDAVYHTAPKLDAIAKR